jgi:uncharacterized membrane protein YjjP (DUF1212 family)
LEGRHLLCWVSQKELGSVTYDPHCDILIAVLCCVKPKYRRTGCLLTSLILAGSPNPLDEDGTRSSLPVGLLGLAVGSISVTSGLALGAPDWLLAPLLAVSFVTVAIIVGRGPSGYEVMTAVEEATSLVGFGVRQPW